MTVTKPIPAQYYSLSVHGEPPEGVEVLWTIDEVEWVLERDCLGRDTHCWMLAPVPAEEPAAELPDPSGWKCPQCDRPADWTFRHDPSNESAPWACPHHQPAGHIECVPDAAEEPPFPLSREEWEEAAGDIRDIAAALREIGNEALYIWWVRAGSTSPFDYDAVVSAWRAAGFPGAGAPEGEAEEGPWRFEGGKILRAWASLDMPFKDSEMLRDLVSDANDAHRLRGELEKAQAEVVTALTARVAELEGALRTIERSALSGYVKNVASRALAKQGAEPVEGGDDGE